MGRASTRSAMRVILGADGTVFCTMTSLRRVSTNAIECKPLVLPLDLPQVNLGPQNQAHLSDCGKADINV